MTGETRLLGRDVVDELEAAFRTSGLGVYVPGAGSLPGIVALHPAAGLIVLDVVDREEDGDGMVALNRKVTTLRESVPALARTPITRRVVALAARDSGESILTVKEAVNCSWLGELRARPVDPLLPAALDSYFAPRLAIDVPLRRPLTDEGATRRAAGRILLDEEQSSIAQRTVDDVLLVTGPPGSGKTLVLAARAKWLARQHPGWRIQILCYNRMLVPYLEQLVWGHANVSVKTVGRFSSLLGVRMSLTDQDRAARELAPALRTLKPRLDALLIDEWQDFFPAWTELALAAVHSGRGGVVLAGDPRQALYRESDMWSAITGHQVEYVELPRPYRSTRQVLEVTSALREDFDLPSKELGPDGEPVDLVWAETSGQQADAVTRDILLLLESGERLPQEIGVLVTRKWVIGQIVGELLNAGIPCRSVYANQADELDLGEPTVKVTTVHSAKGLEFDVVFLVGLEHLPNPDGSDDGDRQGRTGYVGATRARDQLVLTYSKGNEYLERIRSLPSETLRRWVWPDDYPEA